jgi:hypothetical protein
MGVDSAQLAEAFEAPRVEVINPEEAAAIARERGQSGTRRARIVEAAGTGKTTTVLRLILESEFAGASVWATAVRNALIHEGLLRSAVLRINPSLDVDSFLALLVEAMTGLQGSDVESPRAQFTEAELAELESENVEIPERRAQGPGVAARTAAEYAALLTTALSVSNAAALLHVDESRVRQRLTKGTLYGKKTGGNWRLPKFQFTSEGQVPGIDQVLLVFPSTLHPVAVQRWFTTPIPDLEVDGATMSPVDWLAAGGSPAPLIEIARDL